MSSALKLVASPDYLAGPAPSPTKTIIDFPAQNLPELKNHYAVVLDGVLSPEECATFIKAAEESTPSGQWERAMVNIGGGRQALYEETRKSGRIILDNKELMGKVWARCEPLVPELGRIENQAMVSGLGPMKRREVWKFSRGNERMRVLKYGVGEFFNMHCDGTYETPDGLERSYYTLQLYLKDSNDQEDGVTLKGGATTFWALDGNRRYSVQPKTGSVLIFQQRNLLHTGDEVTEGIKITMRSDLMYSLSEELAPETEISKAAQEAAKRKWEWTTQRAKALLQTTKKPNVRGEQDPRERSVYEEFGV